MIDIADPLAAKINDVSDLEAVLPGTVDAMREWLQLYKSPTINEFAFGGACRGRHYALSIIAGARECAAAVGVGCEWLVGGGRRNAYVLAEAGCGAREDGDSPRRGALSAAGLAIGAGLARVPSCLARARKNSFHFIDAKDAINSSAAPAPAPRARLELLYSHVNKTTRQGSRTSHGRRDETPPFAATAAPACTRGDNDACRLWQETKLATGQNTPSADAHESTNDAAERVSAAAPRAMRET